MILMGWDKAFGWCRFLLLKIKLKTSMEEHLSLFIKLLLWVYKIISLRRLKANKVCELKLQYCSFFVTFTEGISFLRPLKKLKNLYLTGNSINSIGNGDLTSLIQLKELSLDQNKIEKVWFPVVELQIFNVYLQIHKDAFRGLKLKKIFLNENGLYYLSVGTFDDLDPDQLDVVDLSGK